MNTAARPAGASCALFACAALAAAGAGPGARAQAPEVGFEHVLVDEESGAEPQGMRILGALALSSRAVDGHTISGLSGLGWDDDDQRLYAVSDRGIVFVFEPRFTRGRLTGLLAERAAPLRGRNGRPLASRYADAEGLALDKARNGVRGDAELVVSFERLARVNRYTAGGQFIESLLEQEDLRAGGVEARSNQGLESVALHPEIGIIVGLEQPQARARGREVPLLAADGRSWRYPLLDVSNASLTAVEAMPDGSLVTLERGYGLLLYPLNVALRTTRDPSATPAGGLLDVRTLTRMSTSGGHKIDNLEGLARHAGNRFFIVSDDNGSALQSTLLLYLELTGLPSG